MGYEMMKLIFDIVFGVCILGLGLYIFITPYERLKAKNPQIKSEKVFKTCGVLDPRGSRQRSKPALAGSKHDVDSLLVGIKSCMENSVHFFVD